MSAPVSGMSCENCVYFERTNDGYGECRRHAPQPNSAFFVTKAEAIGVIKTDIHWPKVYNSNWCGQFAARKKTQAKSDQVPAPKRVVPPTKPAEGEEVLKLRNEELPPRRPTIPIETD